LVGGDVCIGVESEQLWGYLLEVSLDLGLLLFLAAHFGQPVLALVVKGLVGVSVHTRVEEPVDQGLDETLILVVSHSTALVEHSSICAQHFILDIVTVVNHHFELVFGDSQVSVAEVVGRRGPPNGAELLSVDENGMEQHTSEE